MTVRLTLLCHAATAAVRAASFPCDDSIDDRGRAAALALRTTIRPPDRALTSPARRAVETAAAVGLAAVVEPLLRDADYGRWAGRAFDAVAAEAPEAIVAWMSDPDAVPHGGESLRDLLGRTAAWLDAQAKPAGGGRETIVAVTHAAVTRGLVVHAIGAPPPSFWRIDIAPLSRTVLQGDGRRWTLASLNQRFDAGPP